LNLKTIDDLTEANGTVDMLLKVISHTPTQDINTRIGPKRIKKISAADITQKSIEIALWGEMADMMDEKTQFLNENCTIALMGAT